MFKKWTNWQILLHRDKFKNEVGVNLIYKTLSSSCLYTNFFFPQWDVLSQIEISTYIKRRTVGSHRATPNS